MAVAQRLLFVVLLVTVLLTTVAGLTLLSGAPLQKSPKAIYIDKCSVCHGEDGRGRTSKGKRYDVKEVGSDEFRKMTDAQLLVAVLKGKGQNMPGFEKELGADMGKKIVAYMRTLSK